MSLSTTHLRGVVPGRMTLISRSKDFMLVDLELLCAGYDIIAP